MLHFAARINGLTGLCMNHLDTIGKLDYIRICTGYRLNGQVIDYYPTSLKELASCEPVYEEFESWKEIDISRVRRFNALPQAARTYIKRIEELVGVPMRYVGVGQEREQTITL
jgi:adenylosuccinate synthase